MGQRYRRIKYWKPWPDFALSQDFVKGRGFKPKVKIKNVKIKKREEATSVIQTDHRRGVGSGAPTRWAIFCNFWEKIPVLMPLDHISRVLKPFKILDFYLGSCYPPFKFNHSFNERFPLVIFFSNVFFHFKTGGVEVKCY